MKYERKTHQLKPFILQFKIQLVISLILLITFCVNAFIESNSRSILLNVTPKYKLLTCDSLHYTIMQNSLIHLNDLRYEERLLAKSTDIISDPIYLVQTLVFVVFIIVATFGIKNKKYFNIKISKWVLILFFFQLFFVLLNKYRDYYTAKLIKIKTNGNYIAESSFESLITNGVLFTVIILWLYYVFKSGEKLQEENDLTV